MDGLYYQYVLVDTNAHNQTPYRMYIFSNDNPNIDGDGTKTLAVAG